MVCNQRFQLWDEGILIDRQLSEQMAKRKLLTFCLDPQKCNRTDIDIFFSFGNEKIKMVLLVWSRKDYNLVYLKKYLGGTEYDCGRSRANIQNSLLIIKCVKLFTCILNTVAVHRDIFLMEKYIYTHIYILCQ